MRLQLALDGGMLPFTFDLAQLFLSVSHFIFKDVFILMVVYGSALRHLLLILLDMLLSSRYITTSTSSPIGFETFSSVVI